MCASFHHSSLITHTIALGRLSQSLAVSSCAQIFVLRAESMSSRQTLKIHKGLEMEESVSKS